MVEFLNTEKAYSQIVEIVSKACQKLVLISPYLRIPKPLLERMKYVDGKGIRTIIVCRGKDLKSEERDELKQLKNLELRFDEDLHAKCFYNEASMVITSLNLHEHSQQHNREMGILLSRDGDTKVFQEALDETEYIISRAKRDSLFRSVVTEIVKEAKTAINTAEPRVSKPKTAKPRQPKITRPNGRGYCIRCGERITLDLDTPFCLNCYRVWKKYKDPMYIEEYCHRCGAPNESTSMQYPVCIKCARKIS